MGRAKGQVKAADDNVVRRNSEQASPILADVVNLSQPLFVDMEEGPATRAEDLEHMLYAMQRPVFAGAQKRELISLDDARKLLADNSGAVLALSDVHGYLPRLKNFLRKVGVADEQGNRIDEGRNRVVQVGDLVDGRDIRDLETLEYGQKVFDEILVGNHEAAMLGGQRFDGLVFINPNVVDGLKAMLYDDKLKGATTAHGVLLVHAGINKNLVDSDDAEQAAQMVNDETLFNFFGRSIQSPMLFGRTNHGGRGGRDEHGGAFWQDLRQGLEPEQVSTGFHQIVGHTPLGSIQGSDHITGIDCTGPRLGAAIILPDGSIQYTSDVLPA